MESLAFKTAHGDQARFNGPNGIAASVTGDTLFISELNNPGAIRLIDLSDETTSVSSEKQVSKDKLFQNHPNPFSNETTIQFELIEAGNVRIDIYNFEGQHIDTLLKGWRNAGKHKVIWTPKKLPAGVYIYKLERNGEIIEKKAVLINE